MNLNIWAILVAALVSLPIGFFWYHPKVLGTAWMKSIGATEESIKQQTGNMGLIFLLATIFAFLIAFSMSSMVIHQFSLYSLLMGNPEVMAPDAKIELLLNGKPQEYLHNFRTFRHGAFHGFLLGLLVATPIIGTNALFERKGFKYIAINGGYWIVTMVMMGGIICGWE
jgi:hypothetical protein